MNPDKRKARKRALLIGLGVLALMLALAAAWKWTPLKEVADAQEITRWLDDSAGTPWMPFVVAFIYVAASLVMFPNTVLSLAVILALGPLLGTAYAFGGSLVAALAGHSMGRWGGKRIEKLRVKSFDKMCGELRRGGFVQVLTLRLLPLAPFSATNILAGAARVRLVPFLAATAVGISPYILTFGMFGRQARRLLSDPTPADAGLAAGIVAVALIVVWWTRSRWKNE